jgi:hypothetical protein
MKNKNLKIAKMGLVTFLLIVGFSPVFVNAAYYNASGNLNSISSDPLVILSIDSPSDGSSFLEPMPFQTTYINIHVVNQFGSPVYDAWVHVYLGQSQNFMWEGFTNVNGIAHWPEPNVDQDTTYRIKAEKFVNGNHQESTIYVTIRNRYLTVSTNINPVDEGKEFFGIVKDQDNRPVPMAKVKFNGKILYTNSNGRTSSFTAPWVNKNTTFTIKTSARLGGYDDGISTVTVLDKEYPKPHKVYGQVRDYDFIPLQNVKITIIKGTVSYTTRTNATGDYILWVTPKEGGEYITITASFSGYPTQSVRRWVSSTNTDPIHINFWLIKDGKGNQNAPGQQQVQELQSQQISYQQVNYS